MRPFAFSFSLAALLAVSCARPPAGQQSEFTFAVLDVGQGLSQVGVCDGRALVWDIGPRESYERWAQGYEELGSPRITALVLSHADEDHRGGLSSLRASARFSGMVVMSVYEDTALVRRLCGAWRDRLVFRTIAAGDTVGGLDGVRVECLWPPRGLDMHVPVESEERNRFSLVFRVTFGDTRVLVTSDIDSSAMGLIEDAEGGELAAGLVMVPHHGSAGSVHRAFYGFVMPSWAVVSCALHNDYGHPAPEVLDLLFELGIPLLATSTSGHVVFRSNGLYWVHGMGTVVAAWPTPIGVGGVASYIENSKAIGANAAIGQVHGAKRDTGFGRQPECRQR